MPSRDAAGPAAVSRCARVMHALQGAFKVFLQCGKRNVEGGLAGDHDVIMRRGGEVRAERRQCGLETAPDAVADDGVADLLGDGEAETRTLGEPASAEVPPGVPAALGLVSSTNAGVAQRAPPRTARNSARVFSVTRGTRSPDFSQPS